MCVPFLKPLAYHVFHSLLFVGENLILLLKLASSEDLTDVDPHSSSAASDLIKELLAWAVAPARANIKYFFKDVPNTGIWLLNNIADHVTNQLSQKINSIHFILSFNWHNSGKHFQYQVCSRRWLERQNLVVNFTINIHFDLGRDSIIVFNNI